MFDDPFAVDRRLREAARAWLAWRRALRLGAGEEHRFETLGAFASAELVQTLRSRDATDPLAPAQSRWAYHLYLEHQTRELVVGRERAYRTERHALAAPEPGKFTLREMLGAALANTKGARSGFVEALSTHAAAAQSFELRRRERRIELSNTLGDPATDAVELPAADVIARARRFLEETNEPMAELGVRDVRRLFEVAIGSDTAASWPSRLTVRTLAGLFDETKWLANVPLDLEELPQALGASSFLRGLLRFGAALRSGLAPTTLPFSVAHDPFDLAGATHGALFALVPFGASFSRRKLEIARTRLGDHRRVLARVLLVGARSLALRVALRDATLEGAGALRHAFPELVHLALGVELRPSAAGVLVRSRVSDPVRFAALLVATEYAARLESTYDEDWYRNPRAVEEVRENARQRPERSVAAGTLDAGARELARFFANVP